MVHHYHIKTECKDSFHFASAEVGLHHIAEIRVSYFGLASEVAYTAIIRPFR